VSASSAYIARYSQQTVSPISPKPAVSTTQLARVSTGYRKPYKRLLSRLTKVSSSNSTDKYFSKVFTVQQFTHCGDGKLSTTPLLNA